MSNMPDIFGLAMIHEATLGKITTLGVEYEGGHLPQDRFCKRVLQLLVEHQKSLIEFNKRHDGDGETR